MQKIVRTVTNFVDSADANPLAVVDDVIAVLQANGYEVQTRRACFSHATSADLPSTEHPIPTLLSHGRFIPERMAVSPPFRPAAGNAQLERFLTEQEAAINLDVTDSVAADDVALLFEIIRRAPGRTFSFAYTFNNAPNSPYFPSSFGEQTGFAIGLQSTNLAASCTTLEQWFDAQRHVWDELMMLFDKHPNFLGIDSSVAPLAGGDGSFVAFVRRLKGSFSAAATSDLFVQITKFLKSENPRPIGLCGLMFPCLEDGELAVEYELGNFSIERNIFLSLHSGLGIDTYPIGIDESAERVLEILQLMRALSEKYQKPLSARFVSDGRARIGERTYFDNPYLNDVVVRPL